MQLGSLGECLDYRSVQKALAELPETLDETYSRILDRIPKRNKRQTIRLLQFLAFSQRPLRIDEAVDAIAVETVERPGFDRENRMPNPEEISAYCSSLVVISERKCRHGYEIYDYNSHRKKRFYQRSFSSTGYSSDSDLSDLTSDESDGENGDGEEETVKEMQLAHYSVEEYLKSDKLRGNDAKDFKDITIRVSISQVCLAYLLELDQHLSSKEIDKSFPLARFAAEH